MICKIYNLCNFVNGINFDQLYGEISVQILTNKLENIISDDMILTICFNNDLTDKEIATLDNIVINFIIIVPDGSKQWAFVHKTVANVGGGTLIANTWNDRPLNLQLQTDGHKVYMCSDSLGICPGNYRINIYYISNNIGHHKIAIYNETASQFIFEGMNEYADAKNNSNSIEAHVNISQYSVIKFKQYAEITNKYGIGDANPFSMENIYMKIVIYIQ